MIQNRIKFLAGIGSAGLMLFGWLINPAIGADRLRIGLSSFTPINAAVWIAEDKGLFKKYGIDPEVIVVGGASAGGVSSLIAGDIQFLTGGGGAVINAALNGADVVMVASIVNKGAESDGSRRSQAP
jgi:ABC-type nitrate/sulfonate/bicarbonate transport system substrate-binding protein